MKVSIDEQIEALQIEVSIIWHQHRRARPPITDQAELDHLKRLRAAVRTLEKVKNEG